MNVLWATVVVTLCLGGDAFYVPGIAPTDFVMKEEVEIKAVKITSVKSQLPYLYYSLPFCQPASIIYKGENLGEVLRGDRIVNTPFKVNMAMHKPCTVMCRTELTEKDTKLLFERIRQEYSVHLITDNLPCATKYKIIDSDDFQYEHGYKLGFIKDEKTYLNNHLVLNLKFHVMPGETEGGPSTYRVVGFEVDAKTRDSAKLKTDVKPEEECGVQLDGYQEITKGGKAAVVFSYEVNWVESEIKWASRWDIYLAMTDVQIHWFSIINSVVVVFFLAGILTMIIIRTLRRDIAKYNQMDDEEDALEESGWKLVHGDVFRAPRHSKLLSSLVGSGLQILCATMIVIVFAMLGMLSPASRGALMTAAICLFMFMGIVAGYYSARLYKTIKGVQWKKAAFMTSMIYPAVMFSILLFLNFFLWGKKSTGGVPFTTLIKMLSMWLGISLPLVYIGYYFGYRKQPYEHPVRVNQIPRQVPEQQWYLNPFIGMLMAGILPFGAMFIELFFIFTAIWENQYYYLFGFLFLVFIILIISCSQISIVMVYFQLCGEDYHWWWRSFIISGGSAFYVFAYSIFYFWTKLEITEFIPTILYFGYTTLMVFTFWLLTGTIGFYAAYFFVRKIYGAIKVE